MTISPLSRQPVLRSEVPDTRALTLAELQHRDSCALAATLQRIIPSASGQQQVPVAAFNSSI